MSRLRADRAALAAREHTAVLQLYALDTSLDHARGRLASLDGELASARRDRDAARSQLRAAERTLAVAQARLGAQLRALYERDNPDVLAVLVGASTLDDVITGLDNANRSAESTTEVIAATRSAQARVTAELASLNQRAERLARLRELAAAQAAAIERARTARSGYVQRLRSSERLTSGRIAALEKRARAAEAASTVVTVQAQAAKSLGGLSAPAKAPTKPAIAPPAPPPAPAAPAPIQPASGSGKQLTVVATAYSLHGGTASGLPTAPGVVAVDPTVIPLGTRMYIPGYGPGIAADTGTAIKGLRIDLWFPTLSQAESWGRRTVTITLR